MNSLARSISRNLSASVVARLFTGTSNLIFAALVGRYIGKAGLGTFTTAIYLVSIAQVGVNWGLNTLTPREVARTPDRVAQLLLGNIVLRLLLTPVGIALLLLISFTLNYSGEVLQTTLVLSLSLFATALSLSSQAVFMGSEHLEYYTAGVIVANVVFLVAILIAGMAGAGLGGLLVAYLVFRTMEALTQFALLQWQFRLKFSLRWVPGEWLILFKQGIPFFLLDFLVVLGQRADVLMLTSLSDTANAGEYAAAYRVVEVFLIGVTGLNEALLPVLARLWPDARHVFSLVLERLMRYLMLGILPLIVGIAVFADDVIRLLFSSEFQEASLALRLLIPVLIPWFLNAPLTRAILATDNQRVLTQTMGLRLVAVVVLNLILVPALGVYGAAIATVTAILLVFFRNVWFVHRHIVRLEWVRGLLLPLLAGLAFCLVVFFMPGGKLGKFSLGLFFYLVTLFLVRAVDARDIGLLKQAFSRG